MRVPRTNLPVALLGVAILGIACDELTAPAFGHLDVQVDETGADVPGGGYVAAVDNGSPQTLDPPSLLTRFTSVPAGVHTVRLDGLAPHCAVVGENPRTVEVVGGRLEAVLFSVSCVRHAGTVRVTTVTTGSDQDVNGYGALVNGFMRAVVGPNATIAIADVPVGEQVISLGDVAPNCAVDLPIFVEVDVAFRDTVEVSFHVQCVISGTLEVTVRTTGDDVDPDGYLLEVHAASLGLAKSMGAAANGTVAFASLPTAADYRVTVRDMTENCDVVEVDPSVAVVTAGGTTIVEVDVACSALPRLALTRSNDIYAIAANGAGLTRLTTDPGLDSDPAWSSTGQIAFTSQRSGATAIYVINEDGTNERRITASINTDEAPSWSPDGGKIVFRSSRDANAEIYVMNADGTGATRLTNNPADDRQPAWSSAGKIAFLSDRDDPSGEIYVMNEDGSNVVRLTHNLEVEANPAWSPDGSMIAFSRLGDCSYYWYACSSSLFVMNADGTNERELATGTGTNLQSTDPSWSPMGNAIAFTRMACPYYCEPAAVYVIDLQGSQVTLIASESANPTWKP
jgi:TolB protein